MRNWFYAAQADLDSLGDEALSERVEKRFQEWEDLFDHYRILLIRASTLPIERQIGPYFTYIDEFISTTYDEYLLNFLSCLRRKEGSHFEALDRSICEAILKEKRISAATFSQREWRGIRRISPLPQRALEQVCDRPAAPENKPFCCGQALSQPDRRYSGSYRDADLSAALRVARNLVYH